MRLKDNKRFSVISVCIVQALIVFICFFSAGASVLERVPSKSAVNDYAGMLDEQTEAELESYCRSLYNKTGVSFVFIIDKSLGGESIEQAASKVFEKWGIGKKGVDEGALVLIAVKDRKIRIETGYGSEGYITDLHSSNIIRNIALPLLKQGRWNDAVIQVFYSLAELAAKEKNVNLSSIISKNARQSVQLEGRQKPNVIGGILFLIMIVVLLSTRTGRAMLPWLLLASMSSSRRSFGSGGFGGGFSGGGFGGFGGGMSGGGGASGSF